MLIIKILTKRGGEEMKKFLVSLLLLAPAAASAQTAEDWGINDFASGGVNLGTRPLRETISGVVNIILGFLGILATLIILMGGFKWMTSQGNSDKVDEAKKMIGAGVIGLVIVLVAYAVARFVLASVANETV